MSGHDIQIPDASTCIYQGHCQLSCPLTHDLDAALCPASPRVNNDPLRLRRESLSKLAVHVNIASQLNAAVDSMRLTELSALEQSLVFGEAGTKELIAHLTPAAGTTASSQMDKLRLLFIFTCMHPDKARVREQGQRHDNLQLGFRARDHL